MATWEAGIPQVPVRGGPHRPRRSGLAGGFADGGRWEPSLRLGRHCAALPVGWDLDQQRRAAAGGTGDLERAPERLDAIAEADQSRPAAGVRPPDPVVA